MTSVETANSVFLITDEINSFSFTIPGYWSYRNGEETINQLQKILELTSKIDIELHVKEVRKRGNQINIGDNVYKFSDPASRENEAIEELEKAE